LKSKFDIEDGLILSSIIFLIIFYRKEHKMKGGIRNRVVGEEIEMPEFMKGNKQAWGSAGDPYDAEDEIYSEPQIQQQPLTRDEIAGPYEPVKGTEHILSNVEKREWKNRIQAMTPQERAVALSTFSVEEIFAELNRRINKTNEYISTIKEVVDQYHEGDL
jgi:hypothetical protein